MRAHLGRHDAGQRRLAEARWSCEQQVVDGLSTVAGRLEHDRQVLFEFALADELVERPRAQPGLDDLLGVGCHARIEELVTHVAPPMP